MSSFPPHHITDGCNHQPGTCLDCIRTTIRIGLDTKLWTDIRCPECPSTFTYRNVQRVADPANFERYDALASSSALSNLPDFRWCLADCGSGQLHDGGKQHPIMQCFKCGSRQCFTHNVRWHTGMTCPEYEEFLHNPETFRSRMELDNLIAEEEQARESESFLAEEEAQYEREERRRRLAVEAERAEKVRQKMARRQREEEETDAQVRRTTKPCPSCQWRIEKAEGW